MSLRRKFFFRENFGYLRGFWEIEEKFERKKYQKGRENFEDDGSLKLAGYHHQFLHRST